MIAPNKDEIANRLWRRSYDDLSDWGKRKVDHIAKSFEPHDDLVESLDPQTNRIAQANLHLAAQLEQARIENLELWDELSQLKEELAELRAEFNPPSS